MFTALSARRVTFWVNLLRRRWLSFFNSTTRLYTCRTNTKLHVNESMKDASCHAGFIYTRPHTYNQKFTHFDFYIHNLSCIHVIRTKCHSIWQLFKATIRPQQSMTTYIPRPKPTNISSILHHRPLQLFTDFII